MMCLDASASSGMSCKAWRSDAVASAKAWIVADEFGVVAVGDEADALGQKRVFHLDLLQADRSLLARDVGEASDLIDQLALGHAPHGEGEFGAERQPVKH
jgi:hypothetical protein